MNSLRSTKSLDFFAGGTIIWSSAAVGRYFVCPPGAVSQGFRGRRHFENAIGHTFAGKSRPSDTILYIHRRASRNEQSPLQNVIEFFAGGTIIWSSAAVGRHFWCPPGAVSRGFRASRHFENAIGHTFAGKSRPSDTISHIHRPCLKK